MTKEEAWAAFAEQYNHRLHGPSDAFKFAWDAATKAEREACALICDAEQKKNEDKGQWMWEAKLCGIAIRARGEA